MRITSIPSIPRIPSLLNVSDPFSSQPALPTAPEAFAEGMWSLADAEIGGALTVTIISLPADGGSTITDIEYRIASGSWVSSGVSTVGTFNITGLLDDAPASITLRAVNAIGNGDESSAKVATPTENEEPDEPDDLSPFVGEDAGQIPYLYDARVENSVIINGDNGLVEKLENLGGAGSLYDLTQSNTDKQPTPGLGAIEYPDESAHYLSGDTTFSDNQHLIIRFWPNTKSLSNVFGSGGDNRLLLYKKDDKFHIAYVELGVSASSTGVAWHDNAVTLEIRRQDGTAWVWLDGVLILSDLPVAGEVVLDIGYLGYYALPQMLAFQSLAIINTHEGNAYDDPEDAVIATRLIFDGLTPSIEQWDGGVAMGPPPTPGIPEESGPLEDGGIFLTTEDIDDLRYTGPKPAGYNDGVGKIIGLPWFDEYDPVLETPYLGYDFPASGGGSITSVETPEELSVALRNASEGDIFELDPSDPYDAGDMSSHPTVPRYGPLGPIYNPTTPIIIRSANPGVPAVIKIRASSFSWTQVVGVVFENIHFKYEWAEADAAKRTLVSLSRCENIKFKDCIFEGDYADFPPGHPNEDLNGMGSGIGIKLNGSRGVIFEGCLISKYQIGVTPSTSSTYITEGRIWYPNRDIDFIGCEFKEIKQDGFSGGNFNRWLVKDCKFHDLNGQVRGSHPDAIQVFSKYDMFALRNCTIIGNMIDVGDGGWIQSIFLNNENTTRYADGAEAGDYARHKNLFIKDNYICNGQVHGISIQGADGVVIQNNTLAFSKLLGADYSETASDVRIVIGADCEDVEISKNIVTRIWTYPYITPYGEGDLKESWTVEDNIQAKVGDGDTADPEYLANLFTEASWSASFEADEHKLIIEPTGAAGMIGAGAAMNYSGIFPGMEPEP